MENYSYNSYPESGHSSPRSREIDYENPPPPWEDPLSNQPPPNYKVKFMCSYGGKIHPRPHDNQLSYIGGETKILSVDRNIKFASLLAKLVALCDSDAISFKYQLPGEDLDALISVTNDDDLEHMMHEYDRLYRVSPKPARLRIFIFPSQSPGLTSARSFGSDEGKTEKERFVEALNSSPIVIAPQQSAPLPASTPPPAVNNVDLLFGFEKGNAMAAAAPPANQPAVGRVQEFDDPGLLPGMDQRLVGSDPIQKHIQDLQRLRIEEQQGIYRRKSEDTPSGGSTGNDHNKMPEKMPQIPVSAGFPYWTEKQVTGGVYHNNEQQVYMIQTPANAYHAPMMRPVAGAPTQGYYAVQRTAADVYQQQQQQHQHQQQQHQQQQQQQQHQQQQMYNMAAAKATGYSENYGMVRPQTTGGVGMVNEAGYAQVAYDSGGGRQFVYSAPGGVMGAPAPVQAAQYQAVSADGRASGALTVEAGAKVAAAKPTQASI